MRHLALSIGLTALIAVCPVRAGPWSPDPWIADLGQVETALKTKYANIAWLVEERQVDVPGLIERTRTRLRSAGSDAEARAIFDRLMERIDDGHVSIEWPAAPSEPGRVSAGSLPRHDVCDQMGFDEGRSSAGTVVALAGYQARNSDRPLPTGIVQRDGHKIGIIRIGGFEPQGAPDLCRSALRALAVPVDRPCDGRCQDAILTWSYDRMTTMLEDRIAALGSAGATILLIDLTGNGGGSEWAEAAARIVSPRPLTSERRGYVRGPHWARQWRKLADQLHHAAANASGDDKARLTAWANEADAARADAERTCVTAGSCPLVGSAGYATGLVGRARAGEFADKPWRDLVFSIAQFPYHDSVWKGPLIVLVDDETWSAAEEFAAVLQDNDAAIIAGSRTGGAGCGRTNGGTPTILVNSRATLLLPDCARFRLDGSNEVTGVIPDILIAIRNNDGMAFKARLIEAKLPELIERSMAQRNGSAVERPTGMAK